MIINIYIHIFIYLLIFIFIIIYLYSICFKVALHKKAPAESLGIQVAADGCYLHVTEVSDGLVQEWNNAHWDMILPGGRITDVKGFDTEVGRAGELRDLLARESMLQDWAAYIYLYL